MVSLKSVVKSLLPSGPLWTEDSPLIVDIIDQIVSSLSPVLVKAGLVNKEFYPSTAAELDRWLADFKVSTRGDLLRKIVQKGSQSRSFYESLIRTTTGVQSIQITVREPVAVGRLRAGQALTSVFRYTTFVIEGVPTDKKADLAAILDRTVPEYMRYDIK